MNEIDVDVDEDEYLRSNSGSLRSKSFGVVIRSLIRRKPTNEKSKNSMS